MEVARQAELWEYSEKLLAKLTAATGGLAQPTPAT
jgi:hypothetical protein